MNLRRVIVDFKSIKYSDRILITTSRIASGQYTHSEESSISEQYWPLLEGLLVKLKTEHERYLDIHEKKSEVTTTISIDTKIR